MGALAEGFSAAQKADEGKYKSFKVGYSGDEAAVTFYLRTPEVFSFVEDAPYSHSGGGRKSYALKMSLCESDIFSLDELIATLENVSETDSRDLSNEEYLTLGTLWAGFHALSRFITQNGRWNPECDLVFA